MQPRDIYQHYPQIAKVTRNKDALRNCHGAEGDSRDVAKREALLQLFCLFRIVS